MKQSDMILYRYRHRQSLRKEGLLYEPNYIGMTAQEREFEQFVAEYTAAIRKEAREEWEKEIFSGAEKPLEAALDKAIDEAIKEITKGLK